MMGVAFVLSLAHSAPKDPRKKGLGFLFPVIPRTFLLHIRKWGGDLKSHDAQVSPS